MKSFPIVFILVFVCLAVAAVEAQTTQPPATTTIKTTAKTTTSSVKLTTTSKTTAKPTTTTTSKTTSKATTTKPVTSTTTVRTTSTKPATTTTTTASKRTTAKTTVKTTASHSTTTAKKSTVVSTTKPTTTTTTKKTTTAGTTPGISSTTSTKSSSTLRSTSTSKASAATTRTTSTTLVPPTTARTTAAPSTTISSPVVFNCSVSDPGNQNLIRLIETSICTNLYKSIGGSEECRTMCGDVTSTTTGVVQSANYPGDYGNESRFCEVSITVPEGWMIQLNFTTFNVETDVGYVYVNDGFFLLMRGATGNTIPALVPPTIGTMYIDFASGPSDKPSTAIYSWRATFSLTPRQSQGSFCSADPACGNMCTNVTSSGSGVVQSPNFPADYGNKDMNCYVTIVVPAGKRIRLAFTTFNVETGTGFVSVAERSTILLDTVTGSAIPPVVISTSNIMYIVFGVYDSTKPTTATYKWQAIYTAVTADATSTTTTRTTSTTLVPPTTARKTTTTKATTTPTPVLFNCSVSDPECGNMCGDVTSPTSGVVQSPDFPGDYGNYSRSCGVFITAPEGWMIQLKFTNFNVETGVGYVYVSNDFLYLLPPTSGNTIPAINPTNIGRMFIGFDCGNSNKTKTTTYNWRATFSVTSQGSSCSTMYPSDCDNMCANVTSNGTGVVQSPNFPDDYGNKDRNCPVAIIVAAGKRIKLTFTNFNVASVDSVSVYDSSSMLWSGNGSAIPAAVTTTANIMYFEFFTSASNTNPNTAIYNWRATYTAV